MIITRATFDATPLYTDTIRLMSTDRLVYLPIVVKENRLIGLERGYCQMLPADGYIRRSQALDVPIQREQFLLKSEEP